MSIVGIDVHYCAEQFENDGGPTSTIIKSVKRAMAGEYSRELSSKVFKGQCRLIELGYRQGGAPGFGLRRMLINQAGESKGLLSRGECKSLQTDRVVLVSGPDNEVQHVRRIYELFTQQGKQESEIASILNADGVVTDLGRPWNRGTVRQVLTNEKYIGNSVYNRTSFKLKKKHVCNPPDIWVRKDNAFPALVSLLREKRATSGSLRELRKVKPMRQIEMAELMCASRNFSVGYAKCLVAATPQEQLLESDHPKDIHGLTADDMARMEREMDTLGREFKIIEESHGRNVLNLVMVVGDLRRLLDNARVVRFLSQNHSEILAEFQKLVEARSLGDTAAVE